jgi:putative DNA primase/helicase
MSGHKEAAALDALREAGLSVDNITWDGVLHRVPTTDKPNSKNGAYIAYGDAPASLWWQDWASGESGTWTAKGESTMTANERAELSRRMEEARKAREAEQASVHAEAAGKAQSIYAAAADCQGHTYLTAKGVKPVPGLKLHKGAVVAPLYDDGGKVVSLQFINEDGNKLFLTGGRKKGCFFPIGGKDLKGKPLLICEGLATGLSLYECASYPALVAFDAGNLLSVAEVARFRYPERKIILCADNDTETEGNPGQTKATAAALAVNGLLAMPVLKSGGKCDFNDIHQAEGIEAVWRCVERAGKPEPPKERLPDGFVMRETGKRPGLYHIEVREDTEPVETWLSAPFEILGETRNSDSAAWGVHLKWLDADGKPHDWAMPRALLAGRDASEWRSVLAGGGLRIASSQKGRGLLAGFFDAFRTDKRVLCVERTGWHRDGDVYVLPDKTFFSATTQNSAGRAGRAGQAYSAKGFIPSSNENGLLDVLDNERIVLQIQTAHNPFCLRGTPDGWRDTIGAWSRGNTRLMLALCASFAGALLEPANMESGGINWTGQSSTGKTTALVAAGSVWGKGSSSGGYVLSWRATSNGLEGLAALHSDTVLCLDEIGQAPGRTIMEAAYMLANGMGKARAFQDGSAKTVKSWRCMVLSTGEKGLAEKIAEEGRKVQAGQSVRLIDIPADAGANMGIFEDIHDFDSPQAFADALKTAAATNYGHAARKFIGKIQEHRDTALSELHEFMTNGAPLLCPDDADGQVKRVARRFLLCAAAGEMAAEWRILPWEKGEAPEAVKTCFDAWLESRGGTGAAEDSAILAQVTLFIEQHGASRFQDVDKPDAICLNRVGFRLTQDTGNDTVYYVLPESFKEICKGHAADKAARVLRDAGLLRTSRADGRGLKTWLPTLPGIGRRLGYILSFGGKNESA